MGSKILIDDCNWKPSKFTCKHLRGPNACMIRMVESKTSILSWKYGFDCNFCLSWLLCFSFSMDFLSVFFTILFFSFNEVLIPLHTHTLIYIYGYGWDQLSICTVYWCYYVQCSFASADTFYQVMRKWFGIFVSTIFSSMFHGNMKWLGSGTW